MSLGRATRTIISTATARTMRTAASIIARPMMRTGTRTGLKPGLAAAAKTA